MVRRARRRENSIAGAALIYAGESWIRQIVANRSQIRALSIWSVLASPCRIDVRGSRDKIQEVLKCQFGISKTLGFSRNDYVVYEERASVDGRRSVTPGAVLGGTCTALCSAPVTPALHPSRHRWSSFQARVVMVGATGVRLRGTPPDAPTAPTLCQYAENYC